MEKTIEWGKIVGVHGIKGELKVVPYIDFAGLFEKAEGFDIGGCRYKAVGVRNHKNTVLLTLEGIDSRQKAEKMRDMVITTLRSEIDLGKGHYFYSDIYGFEVYDLAEEKMVGRLVRVDSFPAGDCYVVETGKGERLVPIDSPYDKGVDLEAGRVLISSIKGLLEDDDED